MSIVTTLGMFIIDENRYLDEPSKLPEVDIIGGAGTYCVIGSRIVSPRDKSHLISSIIDKGSDFPNSILEELNSWHTGIIYRENNSRLTTRGCNIYHNGIRSFKYLTPKLRIEVDDIFQYEDLKNSKCFHLICSIDRCISIVEQIRSHNPSAVFIYEPLPDDCQFEKLEQLKKNLLPLIDIFTPNLDEARNLTQLDDVSEIAKVFTSHLEMKHSGTIIRCGEAGCFINTKKGDSFNLPAYHQDQKNVIDVTGGGNSFCGGFAMGYYLSKGNWYIGGICGNIASGCIIEKLGMPVVKNDLFNDKSFEQRVNEYLNDNEQVKARVDMENLKENFDWKDNYR